MKENEEVKATEDMNKEMLSIAFSDNEKSPMESSEKGTDNREIETEKKEEEEMTKDNDKQESDLNNPTETEMPSQENGGNAE